MENDPAQHGAVAPESAAPSAVNPAVEPALGAATKERIERKKEQKEGGGEDPKTENPKGASVPSPISEPGWFEFRTQAERAGMSGSEPDWDEAWRFQWKRLDFTQQKAAFDGIRDRVGSDDPALKALPANYLKRRMWERAIQDRNGQQRPKEPPRKEFKLNLPPGVKLHE